MKTYSYKQIIQLALPILVGTMMEQIIGLTDTIFLGRVGEVEQGAAAPAGVLYITIFMVGLGFCVGSQIVMSRRNGESNYRDIGTVFYHSLAFLMLAALALFVLSRLFVPTLLSWVLNEPEVQRAATEYLYWRVIGFFFAFGGLLFRAFYVSTLNTKTLTLNSVVMVLSNVAFNYILIFGHFGAPRMGIGGAALGSALAEGVSLLFYALYTRQTVDLKKYGLDRLPKFQPKLLRNVLGISSWTMLQDVLALGTWFIFFLAVEHLGKSELAASNIIRNISSACFMSISAIGATVSTLVGNLMGEGEIDSVRPLLVKTMKLAYMVVVPLIGLIYLFPNPILSIFTDSEPLKDLSLVPLYVLLSSNFICVPAYTLMRGVSASGNTKTAFVTEMVALAFYVIFIFVAILYLRIPFWACTFSEHIYYIILWIGCGLYMRYGRWYERKV